MASVVLLCPDLLFGSNVEGALRAAGHDVARYADADAGREAAREADVLVVDLAAVEVEPLDGVPAVGFYPHVDQETRKRAQAAGFEVVVPRSRMARETAAVVEGALRG